jgi:hypothetical protein
MLDSAEALYVAVLPVIHASANNFSTWLLCGTVVGFKVQMMDYG